MKKSRKIESFFKNSTYWKEWALVNEEGMEFKAIRRLIKESGGNRIKVLDVACGNGRILKQLSIFKNMALWGIDINKNALALAAKSAPYAKLKNGSVYKLPYSTKFFDGVIVPASFMHFERPHDALSELTRVSKNWVFFDLSTKRNLSEWLRDRKIMPRSSVPEFRYNYEDISRILPKKHFIWTIWGTTLLSHKLLTKAGFRYYKNIDSFVPRFIRDKIGHSLMVVGRRK